MSGKDKVKRDKTPKDEYISYGINCPKCNPYSPWSSTNNTLSITKPKRPQPTKTSVKPLKLTTCHPILLITKLSSTMTMKHIHHGRGIPIPSHTKLSHSTSTPIL